MTEQNKIAMTAHQLTKKFGNFTAVDHIDFQVDSGQIFGFLGPNGSGKTTTIRMLLGLLQPTTGDVEVMGLSVRRHSAQIRPLVGYMSQRFSLYNDLSVLENLQFYGRAYGLENALLKHRIQYALKMADLLGREHQRTRDLSGGWRQRLALGAAILHQPKIVFLDEPTAGVDPVSRRVFWDLLYDLVSKGMTIFVTTHYMDEAERCHRLAFIQRGHLIAQGTPQQIKQRTLHGQVLEIAPQDTAQTARVLRQAWQRGDLPLSEVALYGALLHVVAPNIEQIKPLIERTLSQAGLPVSPMAIIPPSLEDVFIASMKND